MPKMRTRPVLEDGDGATQMHGVRVQVLCEGRDDFRGWTQKPSTMVQRYVATYGSKDWHERTELPRCIRFRKLSDVLGVASKTPECDDPPWA